MAAFARGRSSVPFGSDLLWFGSPELCWVYTVSVPPWNETISNWVIFRSEAAVLYRVGEQSRADINEM